MMNYPSNLSKSKKGQGAPSREERDAHETWVVGLRSEAQYFDLFDLLPELPTQPSLHWIEASACEGHRWLCRSACHILMHSLQQSIPDANFADMMVGEASSFYLDFESSTQLSAQDLAALEHTFAKQRQKPLRKAWYSGQEIIERLLAKGAVVTAQKVRESLVKNGSDLSADRKIAALEEGDRGWSFDLDSPFFYDFSKKNHRIFLILENLSGTHWDSEAAINKLQRIQGQLFFSKEAMERYVKTSQLKRESDHRKLGKKLGFFHFQEESPGNVFWHPKGFKILEKLKQTIRGFLNTRGYDEVLTPCLIHQKLWEASGHWAQFSEAMFALSGPTPVMSMKPMSCPCHVQIYNQQIHSYKNLPIRLAEFGVCHRQEASGALHGLMRGVSFTQDDAHIFCRPDQLEAEIIGCIELLKEIYQLFGFLQFKTKCSLRPEKRLGDEKLWDHSEGVLMDVLQKLQMDFEVQPGEGAFYGPKLEFVLEDSMGRAWQCGTIQLDFSLPDRLGARYISREGGSEIPVLIHRAFLGSLERFLGILLEHHQGHLPFWLAPVQCRILPITPEQDEASCLLQSQLASHGLCVETDLRHEKIGLKIREASLQKIPILIIYGQREVSDRKVNVRNAKGETAVMSHNDFIAKIVSFYTSRLSHFPDVTSWTELNGK